MISNKTKGFSLIELLVAVTLSGVIFMGVTSLMISLFQSNTRIRQIDRIDQTKNDIVIELTNAIRWAETINFPGDDQLHLKMDQTTLNRYSYKDNNNYKRLEKNNDPITPSDVIIENFVARQVGTNSNLPLVEISMDIADKQFPTVATHVRFVVSQRVSKVTTEP